MSSQREARGITTGIITVGASSCVGFTSGQGVISVQFQMLTGGTLSLVGQSTMVIGAALFPSLPQNFGGPVSLHINETGGATGTLQFIKVTDNFPGQSYIF